MSLTLDPLAALRASLIFLHLLCFAGAAAAIVLGDLALFAWRRVNAPLLARSARGVTAALAGLWLTGLAVVGLDTGFDPALVAGSGKLLAKLSVVSILTFNGVLLHRYAFPALTHASSTRGDPLWVPTLLGSVSATSWLFAAFAGVARPFAPLGYGGLMAVYGGVLVAALAVAAVVVRPRLRRQLYSSRRVGPTGESRPSIGQAADADPVCAPA